MTQNYRYQNESGRSQDHMRGGRHRAGGEANRDRYETGNEQRYSPDYEDRWQSGSAYNDPSSGFEGNRSYSAGGYPEDFGYRRDRNMSRGGYSRLDEDRFYSGAPLRDQSNRYGNERLDQYGDREYSNRDRDDFSSQYARNEYDRNLQYGRGGMQRSNEFNRSQWDDGRYGTEDYSGPNIGGSRASNFGSMRNPNYGERFGASNQYSNSERSDYGWQGNFGRNMSNEYGTTGPRSPFSSQASSQSLRGRGPKGYERSDERLKEMICERLTDDHNIDASEITVEVTNKVVKLTGTVDNRQAKFQIEDLVERCGGVKDIDNQLRVQTSATSGRDHESNTGQQFDTTYGRSSTESRSTLAGASNTPGASSTKRN